MLIGIPGHIREIPLPIPNNIVGEYIFIHNSDLKLGGLRGLEGEDIIPVWLLTTFVMHFGLVFSLAKDDDDIRVLRESGGTMLEKVSVSRVRRAEIGLT